MLWSSANLIAFFEIITHPRTAFGEHLEHMPVRCFHGIKHSVYKRCGHVLMEQVAHRVDKDHPAPLPFKGLVQSIRSKRQIKTMLKWMGRNASPPFCKTLGITIVAAGGNFGAARYRIPSSVGPLNRTTICHKSLREHYGNIPMQSQLGKLFPAPRSKNHSAPRKASECFLSVNVCFEPIRSKT